MCRHIHCCKQKLWDFYFVTVIPNAASLFVEMQFLKKETTTWSPLNFEEEAVSPLPSLVWVMDFLGTSCGARLGYITVLMQCAPPSSIDPNIWSKYPEDSPPNSAIADKRQWLAPLRTLNCSDISWNETSAIINYSPIKRAASGCSAPSHTTFTDPL